MLAQCLCLQLFSWVLAQYRPLQGPIKQEAPLLLEIFTIIFRDIQPQELLQADSSAAACAQDERRRQAGQAALPPGAR